MVVYLIRFAHTKQIVSILQQVNYTEFFFFWWVLIKEIVGEEDYNKTTHRKFRMSLKYT